MRWSPFASNPSRSSSSSPPSTAPPMLSLLSLALVAAQPVAAMLSCDHIVADGTRFDFSKLKGPHSVITAQHTPPTEQNTTYTLDLCGPLKRKGNVPKGEECPNGSWACAIKRWKAADGTSGIGQVIPLAGSLANHGGKALDHKVTRLKSSESNADSQKEGVRLVLQGGRYPLDGPAKDRQDQRVIVELLCDMTREGTEGEWQVDEYDPEGGKSGESGESGETGDAPPANATMAADGVSLLEAGEKQLTREGENPALIFEGYEVHDADNAFGTLRLTWHTKYACESMAGAGREHWGFFTWFVIIVFLGTASYLIFGSWLNYNRYGARGWDLLPHGDTLRDVPYLLKDWVRMVINTLQGSGSRGGYSAV